MTSHHTTWSERYVQRDFCVRHFMTGLLPISVCKDTSSSHGFCHWECVYSMPKLLKLCLQKSGFLKGQLAEPKGTVNVGFSKGQSRNFYFINYHNHQIRNKLFCSRPISEQVRSKVPQTKIGPVCGISLHTVRDRRLKSH